MGVGPVCGGVAASAVPAVIGAASIVRVPGVGGSRAGSPAAGQEEAADRDAELALQLQMEEEAWARQRAEARGQAGARQDGTAAAAGLQTPTSRSGTRGSPRAVGPDLRGEESLEGGSPGPSDHEVAYAMQLEEMKRAEEARRHRRWRPRLQQRSPGATRCCWDPVWGEIEFAALGDDEKVRLRRQSMASCLYSTCPCVMVTFGCFKSELSRPLSEAEVKLGFRRLALSWASIFALAQVAMLVALLAKYGWETPSANPMLGPPSAALDSVGAKNAAKIMYNNEWWRLLTPMVLHAGWVHLLSNLFLQLRMGIVLEVFWGHMEWLIIYIGSGAYGGLCSCIFMADTLSVGSSGALCGLIGAWVPFIGATWNQTLPRDIKVRNAQLTLVVSSIVLLIPLSFMPMVDAAAHGGGLLMGAALSAVLFGGRLQTRAYMIAMRVAGVIATAGLIVGALLIFLLTTKPAKDLLYICAPGAKCTPAPPGR